MSERNKEVVTVKLEDGGEFLLEVSQHNAGEEDVSFDDNFHIDDIRKSITSISKTIGQAVKDAAPDKFSVEFGIEISAKAGKLLALLCDGEGKANLKITLEWEGKSQPAVVAPVPAPVPGNIE